MANNRLVIVNNETKTYVVIAKSLGEGWNLGNLSILREFLENSYDHQHLSLHTENDDDFTREGLTDANSKGGWEYF